MSFQYCLPVNIIFGEDCILKVGKEARRYGEKVLIVTGKSSVKKTGLLDRVIKILEDEDVNYTLFDEVEPNPLTTTVQKGAKVFLENSCEAVLGIGGGSVMDAAKSIAFSARNEGEISDYITGKKVGDGAYPILLITTTAGTGSEGNSIAVLTNPATKDKVPLFTPDIFAKASFVDPKLFMTMPKKVIASTSFDALCHCIEAYVGNMAQPMSEIMALSGIERIGKNIRRVYQNPEDLEAWKEIGFANTLGGMSIGLSNCGLPHAMEHPVSGLYNVAHGEGLAAVFPEIMSFSYKGRVDKYAKIAIALGADATNKTEESLAKQSILLIKSILKDIGLDITLSELGVKRESIEWMSENCVTAMKGSADNNPIIPSKADVERIYKACM